MRVVDELVQMLFVFVVHVEGKVVEHAPPHGHIALLAIHMHIAKLSNTQQCACILLRWMRTLFTDICSVV